LQLQAQQLAMQAAAVQVGLTAQYLKQAAQQLRVVVQAVTVQ
jgi:hypothetical protein